MEEGYLTQLGKGRSGHQKCLHGGELLKLNLKKHVLAKWGDVGQRV